DLADRVAQVYPDREFSPGERDPHIWLSPKRVKVMIDIIAQELSGIDPENSGIYEKNAERYKKQLDKMDDYIEETLSSLKHRAFIVYHPAFGYFADDYNMEMIAVEEDGKEATARRLQQIIDVAKEKQIKVIFYQAEIDSQQSETLAQEIGGRTQKIEPLAEDYLENLASMADTFKDVLQGE
ncbi:MAG: zinc ABC transporter substrate-binding protein, partial [Clostridia bacterium]|nr:zinc ABC transporter substrate-binding protein [Clostridia bacterium]